MGLRLLWRAVKLPGAILSGRGLCGSMILGWGLFNVVEGTIDHQILQLHHVYQNGNHMLWDLVFLLFGVTDLVLGAALIRSGFRRAPNGLTGQRNVNA